MTNKKFENIIIVSDMDGTFFGDKATLVQRNIGAIEYFKQNGGRFTFSTGRVHYNITYSGDGVEQLCNCPAICANGSCIYDFETKTTLKETYMDTSAVVEAIRFVNARSEATGARCSTPYGFITHELVGLIAKDIANFKGGRVEIKPLDEWSGEKILKLVFRDEAKPLLELRREVADRFGDIFTYASSSPRFFEINAAGCSKADGIRYLRELYSQAKIYAVGDYENDLEMLCAADVSACPENAMDYVKEVADIVLCNCNEGAIADLIKTIEENLQTALPQYNSNYKNTK